MKSIKLFVIFTLAAVTLLFMVSCNKTKISNNSDEVYDTEKTDINGLVIKEKLYSYGENDVLILSVNNPTEKNLKITINVSYFDLEENILKEDSREYDQMYSGGTNNFIFTPEIGFEDYSYSVTAEEFNGKVLAKDVSVKILDLYESYSATPDGEKGYVTAKVEHVYNGNFPSLHIVTRFIVIDKNGELYGVFKTGNMLLTKGVKGYHSIEIYESETDYVSIPKELNGEISIIYDYILLEPNGEEVEELPLPEDFVFEQKEYGVAGSDYYLIYVKNGTDKDFSLIYRTTIYENGNDIGGTLTEFGSFPAGYENHFWLRKSFKSNGAEYENKYEFLVRDSNSEDGNFRYEFKNIRKETVQGTDGRAEVIAGTLMPKYDSEPKNISLDIAVLGIDKSGRVCCMAQLSAYVEKIKPEEIKLKFTDNSLVDTAAEDMEYVVAIQKILPVEW